jgi:hypothetical protein
LHGNIEDDEYIFRFLFAYQLVLNASNMTRPPVKTDILNDLSGQIPLFAKRLKLWLFFIALILGVLNVYLTTVGITEQLKFIEPAFSSTRKIISNTSIPILIVVPVVSFALSVFLSLIPFKKYKYADKYIVFGLAIMVLIQIIITGLLVSDLIKRK